MIHGDFQWRCLYGKEMECVKKRESRMLSYKHGAGRSPAVQPAVPCRRSTFSLPLTRRVGGIRRIEHAAEIADLSLERDQSKPGLLYWLDCRAEAKYYARKGLLAPSSQHPPPQPTLRLGNPKAILKCKPPSMSRV